MLSRRTDIKNRTQPDMVFKISTVYQQIFKIWRAKRFKLFVQRLEPLRTASLLDVGGDPGTWTNQEPVVGRIDTLNVHEVAFNEEDFPLHSIRILVGNGCQLTFTNQSYDIAYSNSVIEHVGTWQDQIQFAQELCRVGRSVWCQTPAFECPIEPHYLTPFVHWLPRSLQRKILRHFTVWGWMTCPSIAEIEEMVETTRLISRKEMNILFPDCEIHTEYLLPFLPKSYIAIRCWHDE